MVEVLMRSNHWCKVARTCSRFTGLPGPGRWWFYTSSMTWSFGKMLIVDALVWNVNSVLVSLLRFGNDLFRGPSSQSCDESSAYRFCWLEIHGCKVRWPGHQPGSQLLGLPIFPPTGHTRCVFRKAMRFGKITPKLTFVSLGKSV